jgi:CubicO group peptidase (beta-lactamase class C family)
VADAQASARITVRQLLTMTSGLPQPFTTLLAPALDDDALERAVRSLRTAELIGPPGEVFGISNGNYETLGLLVQTASGRSYEDYVRQRIFAPLGMGHSFASQAEAQRHGMAAGHRWWFGFPVPAVLPDNRGERPAGYLLAGAEDMAHFLLAELNGGRYGDGAVLSPEGIALTHTAPAGRPYAMGWEVVRLPDRTLLNHDGGTGNSQASVFLDPDARVGVFVAANVMSSLDAFSSPPGASPLDGPTARAMAQSVLSLATHRPLPPQGLRIERSALLLDLAVAALTGGLVVALVRLPGRHRRLAGRGLARRADLAWQSGRTAAAHFAWPLLLLYLTLRVPAWRAFVLFQPDLGYWLEAVAGVVALKGVLELALLRRAFRPPPRRPHPRPGHVYGACRAGDYGGAAETS